MQRAGVEQRRCGRAETAALVEIVEAHDPFVAVVFLTLEEAHRHTHPEELRCFKTARLVAGFVDNEVAVVKCLNAEIVEVEVGGRIERFGEFVEIVAIEQLGVEAFDGDAVLEVGLECGFVGLLELVDAIARDRPVEHLLIDVGKQNATGKFREVGVFFDQRLGIENDGCLEILFGNFRSNRAAQFAFDFDFGQVEVKADRSERNALLEFHAIPERRAALLVGNGDHVLLVRIFGIGFLLFAKARALGAVENVMLGRLEVALAHELFLHHVLHILDVDERLVAAADFFRHRVSDIDRWLGVFLDREKCLAHGDFDFRFRPRHDIAVAADEAHWQRADTGAEVDRAVLFERAAESERLCDIVGFVLEQGLFDEQIEIGFGKAQATTFVERLGERVGHRMGDIGNKLAIHIRED